MKPITDNIKEKANTLWSYMKVHDYVTKSEVMQVCKVNNERSAREIISVLASVKPIISTSDNKGYKLAVSVKDLEEVEHTWAELSSRIEELEKRIQPLLKFRQKYKY